jgi:hypothetical protein
VEAVQHAARTDKIGDGKIFVSTVSEAIRSHSLVGAHDRPRDAWAGQYGSSILVTVSASPVVYLSRSGRVGSTFHTHSVTSAIERHASIMRRSPR